MIRSAHVIRLHPTPAQAEQFLRASGVARFTWNWCLQEYKRIKELKQKVDWNQLKKDFRARIDTDFPFVREVTKCAAEGAIADLRRSINTYYKAKPGSRRLRFPGPRRRSRKIGGFVLNNDQFSVKDNEIRVPRIGAVNMAESLRFPGKIVGGRIKEKAGRWYVAIVVERERPVAPPATHPFIGIDFGLSSFAVTSDNEVCETQAYFRRSESRLRALQRGLCRKKRGSKRYQVWKRKVARCHEHVCSQRSDFAHKFTARVVRQHDVICVEDLDLAALRRTRLAKSFSDAAIGEAVRQLSYKADWSGRAFQKVGRFLPSSKKCSVCGAVNSNLKLSDRVWTCTSCGTTHNRDLNAAINIKIEGLRLLAGSGFVGVTDVELVTPATGVSPEQVAGDEASTGLCSLVGT